MMTYIISGPYDLFNLFPRRYTSGGFIPSNCGILQFTNGQELVKEIAREVERLGEQLVPPNFEIKPDPCLLGKGKGDKYGPLWKAPRMPGWEGPTGDFNRDGPVDYWKKPSDWDDKSRWEKVKWYLGKIGGALAGGI